MADERTFRRLRVEIDVQRRAPTEEERARRARAVAATPNALDEPFESVWAWRVSYSEPEDELDVGIGSMAQGTEDENLPWLIARVRQGIGVELARRLSARQIPIDPRFGELIGSDTLPTRSELARRTATLLDLPEPKSPAAQDLLVDMVLVAHGWYDDPYAAQDSTEVGHAVVSSSQHQLSPEDFQAALDELGGPDDVYLWRIAAELVRRMGFDVS